MPKLKSLISSKTKILIYNNYQNPMGTVSSDEEMQGPNIELTSLANSIEIADLCVKNNLWVLSDEAYFDVVYGKSAHHSPYQRQISPRRAS